MEEVEDARKNALAVGRDKGKEGTGLVNKFAVAEVCVPHLFAVDFVGLERHDGLGVVGEVLLEPCSHVCCVVLLFFETDVSFVKLAHYLTHLPRISRGTENADIFCPSFDCNKFFKNKKRKCKCVKKFVLFVFYVR